MAWTIGGSSYKYRIKIPLRGGSGDTSGFPMESLTIYYDKGAAVGIGEADCKAKCQVDFGDIRLANNEGTESIWSIDTKINGVAGHTFSANADGIMVCSISITVLAAALGYVYVYFGNTTVPMKAFPIKSGVWGLSVHPIYHWSGWYQASEDKTYFCWQSPSYGAFISYYDHVLGQCAEFYGEPYTPTLRDTHNIPVVAVTSDGYKHVVGNCHEDAQPMIYRRSYNTDANIQTNWDQQYLDNDDADGGFYGVYHRAQSFTPSRTHTVNAVEFYLKRVGVCVYTATIALKATDVDGKPTGAALASVTFASGPIESTATWYRFRFSTPYTVTAGVKYCFVLSGNGGDTTHRLFERYDAVAGAAGEAYPGGCECASGDSGATWTVNTNRDILFREGDFDWQTMANPAAEATYPQLDVASPGGVETLYLAWRTEGPPKGWTYSTSVSPFGDAWSSYGEFINSGAETYRPYVDDFWVETDGTVHVAWEWYDDSGDYPYFHIMYMFKDTDDHWYSYEEGSGLTDLGEIGGDHIPMNYAEGNTLCLVRDAHNTGDTPNAFLRPTVVIDSAAIPCLAWFEQDGADANAGYYRFTKWDAATDSWATKLVNISGAITFEEDYFGGREALCFLKHISGTGATAVIDFYCIHSVAAHSMNRLWRYRTVDGGANWAKYDLVGGTDPLDPGTSSVMGLGRIKNADADLELLYGNNDTITGGTPMVLHGWPTDLTLPYDAGAAIASQVLPYEDVVDRPDISDVYSVDRLYGIYATGEEDGVTNVNPIRSTEITCSPKNAGLRMKVAAQAANSSAWAMTQYGWNASAWGGFHYRFKIFKASKTSIGATCGVAYTLAWHAAATLVPQYGFSIVFTADAHVNLFYQVDATHHTLINDAACTAGDVYVDLYYDATTFLWQLYVNNTLIDEGTLDEGDELTMTDLHPLFGQYGAATEFIQFDNFSLAPWTEDIPTWETAGTFQTTARPLFKGGS